MTKANDIAIRVKGVSKTFRLPHEKQNSLKSVFLSGFRRKNYEVQQALKDISFEVKKGEFFGIVGRNGSGKSTLLKCMAGVYIPNEGEIHIHGKLVPFIELGVGFNPDLSGRDNVFLNGALLGFSRKQMEAMYNDIVEFAELEQFMDQKLKNYSSGMQVRLAFSIAIRAQGSILLLDEVLAVGDSAFQRKCLNYFKEIKKTDRTVILVSHSMQTIEEFCDRALMIEDSKIVAIGDPMKISAKYEMANSVYAQKSIGSKKTTAQKERPENPDVKIKKVDVHSASSKTTEFSLKDEVIVEVEVEVRKRQPFYLSLVINNMDGEYIAGINTKNDIENLKSKDGRCRLHCRIAPGQFPNGPYRLTINAITDTETPEIIDVASHEFGARLPIITFTEKSPHKKGKFYMKANWQEDE
jgi:ABC-2 type transport system ATP-binding protein